MPTLLALWTGSQTQAAWAYLHDANRLLLLIADNQYVRDQAFRLHTTLQESATLVNADPKRMAAYVGVLARIAQPPNPEDPVADIDRRLLQGIQSELSEEWDVSTERLRIFRNILTSTIAFLSASLLAIGLAAAVAPQALSLRLYPRYSGSGDVLEVELLGSLGGLLSGVAALQRLKGYQRSYGLPLAQTMLKIPVGAASGFVGVLLLQRGVLTTAVKAQRWTYVLAYAVVFGFAQLAVTRRLDSYAADLLQDASAKSSSVTVTTTSGK